MKEHKKQEHKKIERLILFSEVAEQLNFTEAAKRLAISKGYLSAQIKLLEQELATVLLVRSTRSVRLTQAGIDIAKQAHDMRRMMLAIERNTREAQEDISGLIRITAPQQFTHGKLAKLCAAFKAKYPNISFQLDCSYTKFDLMADDFDIAIRATITPPENLIAKKLFDYHYICCASPDYLAQAGRPKTITELSKHACLTGQTGETWQFDDRQVTPNTWAMVNDKAVVYQQALAGHGIAYLPSYFVDEALNKGELVQLFSQHQSPGKAIYLLRPQLIRPPKKVTVFTRFIVDATTL